ncbi:hypothetical protein CHU98_g6753 [Xylaria longipes]|nr:hypothetical protein CHU98_g6753 [Xylaria longipes]
MCKSNTPTAINGLPLLSLACNKSKRIQWQTCCNNKMWQHLARHRIGPAEVRYLYFEELVTALNCGFPEYVNLVHDKIKSSLVYKLEVAEKEGTLCGGSGGRGDGGGGGGPSDDVAPPYGMAAELRPPSHSHATGSESDTRTVADAARARARNRFQHLADNDVWAFLSRDVVRHTPAEMLPDVMMMTREGDWVYGKGASADPLHQPYFPIDGCDGAKAERREGEKKEDGTDGVLGYKRGDSTARTLIDEDLSHPEVWPSTSASASVLPPLWSLSSGILSRSPVAGRQSAAGEAVCGNPTLAAEMAHGYIMLPRVADDPWTRTRGGARVVGVVKGRGGRGELPPEPLLLPFSTPSPPASSSPQLPPKGITSPAAGFAEVPPPLCPQSSPPPSLSAIPFRSYVPGEGWTGEMRPVPRSPGAAEGEVPRLTARRYTTLSRTLNDSRFQGGGQLSLSSPIFLPLSSSPLSSTEIAASPAAAVAEVLPPPPSPPSPPPPSRPSPNILIPPSSRPLPAPAPAPAPRQTFDTSTSSSKGHPHSIDSHNNSKTILIQPPFSDRSTVDYTVSIPMMPATTLPATTVASATSTTSHISLRKSIESLPPSSTTIPTSTSTLTLTSKSPMTASSGPSSTSCSTPKASPQLLQLSQSLLQQQQLTPPSRLQLASELADRLIVHLGECLHVGLQVRAMWAKIGSPTASQFRSQPPQQEIETLRHQVTSLGTQGRAIEDALAAVLNGRGRGWSSDGGRLEKQNRRHSSSSRSRSGRKRKGNGNGNGKERGKALDEIHIGHDDIRFLLFDMFEVFF